MVDDETNFREHFEIFTPGNFILKGVDLIDHTGMFLFMHYYIPILTYFQDHTAKYKA